jgi:hypothetical protein
VASVYREGCKATAENSSEIWGLPQVTFLGPDLLYKVSYYSLAWAGAVEKNMLQVIWDLACWTHFAILEAWNVSPVFAYV